LHEQIADTPKFSTWNKGCNADGAQTNFGGQCSMSTKSHETTIALGLLLALATQSWLLAVIVLAYGILAIGGGRV
jgi:hypothetical protein